MKVNSFFILFGITMIVIFGGTFLMFYVKYDELLFDQILLALVGLIIVVSSVIWNFYKK